MGGFTSRPMIELPVMPVLRPMWIEHLEPGTAKATHYSASNFAEETPNYRIQYACQNGECRAEVFDKKLNKGMVFTIKDGKCVYNNKQISKTALLELAHKDGLTPLVHLLVQHAGIELPTQHHRTRKIENGSKKQKSSKSVSAKSKQKQTQTQKSKSNRSYVK
jgi:hypothetical protein